MLKSRKRNTDKKPTDYVPCEHCKALYNKKDLWEHVKRCPIREGKYHSGALKNGRLLLPVPDNIDKEFHSKVLIRMNNDEVSQCAKTDPLILEYGSRKWVKNHTKHNFVSGKMRELARLLLKTKELSNNAITTLEMCLDPTNFTKIMEAVKVVSGYKSDAKNFVTPTLAIKLGHSLKICAGILRSIGIKSKKSEQVEQANAFIQLYETDWTALVTCTAHRTLEVNQFNKPKLLPLCTDVHAVYTHLKTHSSELRALAVHDANVYPELAKHALCEVNLFNRKRGGEVERMTIQQYHKGLEANVEADEEVTSTFSKFEKELAKSLKRVEVMGKTQKRVPLLLTENMILNIDTILKLREKVGVNQDNIHVFARPSPAEFPYRGPDCIREVLRSCDIQIRYPDAFTWTNLRKQVATMTQVFEVSDTQQDQVAKFLGHDIRTHRKHYRLPMDLVDKAKVASVLMKVNEGQDTPHIDDIHIDGRITLFYSLLLIKTSIKRPKRKFPDISSPFLQ